jgi:outer membrane lipoprotein-sorting protein
MALAFGLAAAAPLAGQTVGEIVARHLEARGGVAKIHDLQTIRMAGTISFGPGEPAPFALEMKRPGRMRTEFTFQGAVGIQAFDGQRAWAVLPMAGKSEPEYLPAEVSREAAEQADIEGPLVDAAAKGNKVELVGREKVEGRDCFKLMITFKSGGVRYSYIDSTTYLEVKAEGRRAAGGDEVMLETFYRDFRDVSGLQIPHLIEAGPAKRPEKQKIEIRRVEINPPLADSRFERPAPGRRP